MDVVPSVKGRKSKHTTAITVLLTAAALVTFGASAALGAQPADPGGDAVITVVFSADDMGFNITSSKDISNVIVQLCDGSAHKHEAEFVDPKVKVFNHTETQLVTGVWVKSGSNHDPEGPAPPSPYNNDGAGEYFANAGVECNPQTTTTTPPTTSTTTTTGTTPPTTSEIPFFPTSIALVLGIVGALGGTFLLMRRRN